ncbi:hypothetical protein [Tardiphaga sp.]|jgi:hypothetical protein|uniref:hypothetical protein n=1 Tax=Tardiphaga sp. TaxID=1926292 RepID=UPI0037DA7710
MAFPLAQVRRVRKPLALVLQAAEFGHHPPQQKLGCGGIDPGPLEAQDIGPLALDLLLHMVDFADNSVDIHRCGFRFSRIEQNGNERVNGWSRGNSFLIVGRSCG